MNRNKQDTDTRIRHPVILAIYNQIKHMKQTTPGLSRISCTFSLIGKQQYQLRIRFANSIRMVKFLVNQDLNDPSLEIISLQKTDNIARDIDEIYRAWLIESFPNRYADVEHYLVDVLNWGMDVTQALQPSKARCVKLSPIHYNIVDEDVVGYGVVKSTEIDQEGLLRSFTLVSGISFTIRGDQQDERMSLAKTCRPGRIFAVNKAGKTRFMSVETALSLLDLPPIEVEQIHDDIKTILTEAHHA